MQTQETNRQIVVPPVSKEAVEVADSSLCFLRLMARERVTDAKVVLGIYKGQAALAVGPERMLHVKILDFATGELGFPDRIVTSVYSDARAIPGALIQGAHFKVLSWDPPQVNLKGSSDSFGGFNGRLFGQPIAELVTDLLCDAMRKATNQLPGPAGALKVPQSQTPEAASFQKLSNLILDIDHLVGGAADNGQIARAGGIKEADFPAILAQRMEDARTSLSESCRRSGMNAEQMLAAVTKALSALPEKDRIVASLLFHEKLKPAEIAEVLGVNEVEAKASCTKMLVRLKGRLGTD